MRSLSRRTRRCSVTSSGGNSVPVQFKAKISANATDGEYQLPLTIRYRYLRVIVAGTGGCVRVSPTPTAEDTVPVTIRIKPHVKTEVIEAVPEQLTVGSEGYLNLKIKNTGPENGTMASVKLAPEPEAARSYPVDSYALIGDFPERGAP